MGLLTDSLQSAILLLLSWDPELWLIVWVSLKVSALSTLFASLFGPMSVSVATLSGLIVLFPGLTLTTAMQQQPWATPILLMSLGVAFAAIFSRLQPMVFGETTVRRLPYQPAMLPVFALLLLVLMLGLFIPPYLAHWYRAAALLIGGG